MCYCIVTRGLAARFSEAVIRDRAGFSAAGFVLYPELDTGLLSSDCLYNSMFVFFFVVFGCIVFDEWRSLLNTVLNRDKTSDDFVHSAEGEKEKTPAKEDEKEKTDVLEEELLKKKTRRVDR